jgi:hypothetical protein
MSTQPRLTVEECSRLSIVELRRAGLFRGSFGTWGSSRWSDANGKKIRAVVFRLLHDSIAGLILEVRPDIGIALPTLHNSPKQMIPIVATKCNFGNERFWFCCSKVTNGIPCGRRAAVLYLVPGGQIFGCRVCFDLTYRSVQEHDARIDWIVKLSYAQFMQILESGSPAERSLAFRALPRIRRRLEKQLAKYGRSRRSTV